jgi:hypothetical protein
MGSTRPPIVMTEVTDPDDLARARAQRERYDRNFAWLQAHASEVYSRHRGSYICVAGEQLFIADTPKDALALGAAAYPEDDGSFVLYIPREKRWRIYGDLRRLAPG